MKNLSIVLNRLTKPSSLVPYGDRVRVILDTVVVLHNGKCSTNPNPFAPKSPLKPSWTAKYAQVKCGTYRFRWDGNKHKFGNGLLVTSTGGSTVLPTTNANVNHGGAFHAEGVFVHRGYSPVWRGSAACFTVPPADWDRFWSLFDEGCEGSLVLMAGEVN